MTKEELEKKAEVFVSEKADKGNFDLEQFGKAYFSESSMKQALIEFTKSREKRIAELEALNEKMKCGGNCEHLYHVNTGGCYDAKCDLTYCDCINCKDKWELRR